MEIPGYLRADIKQGMNPRAVLAVYCKLCERYLGQYTELGTDDLTCREVSDECIEEAERGRGNKGGE